MLLTDKMMREEVGGGQGRRKIEDGTKVDDVIAQLEERNHVILNMQEEILALN